MAIRKTLLATASAALFAVAGVAKADGDLVRIATVPAGAEVAGIAVNGLGELFFNAQHPGKKATYKEGGPAAEIGYIAGMLDMGRTLSDRRAGGGVCTNSLAGEPLR